LNALQRIESVQLGDRTFESIHTAIVTVELAPGEPIKDGQLAEALGVSRTPVRMALHRLEAAGLVELRGRAGWVVSPFTEQDVHELFELRRRLEPAGIDRLEQEPDAAAIDGLSGFFGEYSHPIRPEQFPGYFAHDHAFHKELVACSGNRRLQSLYTLIESHIDRGRHFLSTGAVKRVDETLDEHRAIVEAITARDFARARRELVGHLQTGEDLMTEQLRHRLSATT
jgi:DNA-binding GntR family transcriptional regulator